MQDFDEIYSEYFSEIYKFVLSLCQNHAQSVPDSESVIIFSSDDDNSQKVNIKIPELGNVTLTEDTIEKCKYATVVSISSEYFLRTIRQETKGDTIYIYAFKTTLFNNKAENYQKMMNSLEFNEINKIIFVDDNEKETVMWSK